MSTDNYAVKIEENIDHVRKYPNAAERLLKLIEDPSRVVISGDQARLEARRLNAERGVYSKKRRKIKRRTGRYKVICSGPPMHKIDVARRARYGSKPGKPVIIDLPDLVEKAYFSATNNHSRGETKTRRKMAERSRKINRSRR